MTVITMAKRDKNDGYHLTGRRVLLMLIAFFVIVFGVNIGMAYLAVETFSGVQTEKPYENGLAYNRDIAVARAQDAKNWMVEDHIIRTETCEASIDVRIFDSQTLAIAGLAVSVTLKAPADSHRDHRVQLTDAGNGRYHGLTPSEEGQWDIETIAQQNGDVVYHSINRIILH